MFGVMLLGVSLQCVCVGLFCVCVCCAFLFDLGLVAGSYLIPLGCWFHLSFLAAFVTIRCAKQEQLETDFKKVEF